MPMPACVHRSLRCNPGGNRQDRIGDTTSSLCFDGPMVNKESVYGRSLAESDVIRAVWKEVGGELIEEFVVPTIPGDRSRAREIDGVFAVDGPTQCLPARTCLPLHGRDVVVCQAKAGQLDLGVLGQTLFAAKLMEREHAPRSLRLIAAAVKPNPLIERLLESYMPFGWRVEHRTYPDLTSGRSSGAKAPAALGQELVSVLHGKIGGLLLAGARRGRADFANVTAAGGGESLRQADPDAIILPARRSGRADARSAVEVAVGEPVILVYACTDLYMTPLGRAVFGGEIARRFLGLADVTSVLGYRTDNAVLRQLAGQLPHIVLAPEPAAGVSFP
jgi:hypothetical protein